MNKARVMIALVFLLLFSGVGANVYLVYAASGDPSFAVEPSYYDKAVRWDEAQAERAESAALGWRPSVKIEEGRAIITLVDGQGLTIEDAEVELELFHNARSKQRTSGRAKFQDGGYELEGDFRRRGLWIARIRAERERHRFVDELEVERR